MRIATMAPAAAVLLTVSVGACGSEPATTSGDGQRTTESPGEQEPGGGGGGDGGGSGGSGGDGGSGGSGGSGGNGGRGGQPGEPATNGAEEPSAAEETDSPQEDEGEFESTDGPVMLALGASHRFEDGFTVTMSSVERLTEPAPDRSDTSADDVPSEAEPLDEESVEEPTETPTDEPTDEPTVENEESEEEPLGEEPTDDPVDEETAEETDEPISEEPVEEEPTEEGSEEEGDDYYAWSVEITNGTGEDRHTGSVLTSCSVGSPLTESSAPLLGAALEPPMVLSTDETGSWDEDCWADEDDPTLQWTLEFIDEQGRSLYPPLIFEGRVG